VRRGAACPANRPSSCLSWRWPSPVPRSVIPLAVLAAAVSWLVARPDASAQRSVHQGSSGQAPSPCSTMPGRQPWRRSPVRVQQAVSTHPVPSSETRLSSPSGVQSPGFVVRDLASGRLVSTGPVSSRLVSARPSGRVRLVRHQAVAVGDRPMRHGNPTTGTGPGSLWAAASSSGSVDGRAGPDAGDAAEATQGRRAVGGGPGSGGGGGRGLTLASWAGQAGVPSARRRRLREGTARGRRARLPDRPGGCRPRDGWGDHPAWWWWRCRPRGRARRGRWACRRGWACGPSAAQAASERSRLAADSALTCDDGWWACQDLNLGPHPYQVSRAHRCADQRFPRSLATVRGEVMRS
jgi:hypothetical protein